jgi:hypothetical protein
VESHPRAQCGDVARSWRERAARVAGLLQPAADHRAARADTVVARILDQLGLPNPGTFRWAENE